MRSTGLVLSGLWPSRSRRTAASAFSVMKTEQLVWRTNTCAMPQATFAARTARWTSAVISIVPRPVVATSNCVW